MGQSERLGPTRGWPAHRDPWACFQARGAGRATRSVSCGISLGQATCPAAAGPTEHRARNGISGLFSARLPEGPASEAIEAGDAAGLSSGSWPHDGARRSSVSPWPTSGGSAAVISWCIVAPSIAATAASSTAIDSRTRHLSDRSGLEWFAPNADTSAQTCDQTGRLTPTSPRPNEAVGEHQRLYRCLCRGLAHHGAAAGVLTVRY
jgi:hypothetical protein